MQQQQAGWGVVLTLCQQFEMQNAGSGSAMSLIGICCVGRSEAGGCDLQREVVVEALHFWSSVV